VELDKRKVEAKARTQRHTIGIFEQHRQEKVFCAATVAHLTQPAKEKLATPCPVTATQEHTREVEVSILSVSRSQDAKS
jgi:hypothetical protein